MTWTPLHRGLGDISSELTYSHIQQAVEQKVEESAELDWKSTLPLTPGKGVSPDRKEKERYELAKDIAAMANSGGGMIVYGVGETTVGTRTAAGSITSGLQIPADYRKSILQAAFSTIHPPVVGLDLMILTPDDDSENPVLAMMVNQSNDAPHLVVQKGDGGFFQAPWRNGPETFFMTERDLATAYRRREQDRRAQLQEMDDLHDRFLEAVGTDQRPSIWTVAIALPMSPPSYTRHLTQELAEQIYVQASRAPWNDHSMTGLKEALQGSTTRRGLRHYFWTSQRVSKERAIRARVEVHQDGSLVVGFTRDGLLHPQDIKPDHAAIDDIEKTGLDLVALILTQQAARGHLGDYDVTINVAPRATIFRKPDTQLHGLYTTFSNNDVFPVFRPVKGTVVTTLGRPELLSSAIDIINDTMNQVNSEARWTSEMLNNRIASMRSEYFSV